MFKVLVVEDEKVIRKGLQTLIKDLTKDFVVIGEAADGKRALELLRHSTPDVLLTDIRMPVMDGLTLIEKARELYPTLSIVIISGHDDFAYAKKAIRYGVNDYLLKPINHKEFVSVLGRIKQKVNEQMEELHDLPNQDHPDIKRISRYIWQNIDQEISLSTIAELVYLHPSYFSQWFKKETGVNFKDFVTTLKMEKAKRLLMETELKVYEVAALSGYQSEKHFLKTFKRVLNQTPSEFRRTNKLAL